MFLFNGYYRVSNFIEAINEYFLTKYNKGRKVKDLNNVFKMPEKLNRVLFL